MNRERFRRLHIDLHARERQFLIHRLRLFAVLLAVPTIVLALLPAATRPLPTLLHLGVLLGFIAHMARHGPRSVPPDGLLCATCGHALLDTCGQHALATGECPRCGAELFKD